MSFNNRIIILTGAAQGIGEAMAKQFAAEGAQLALADIHNEGLQRVAADCRAAGVEVLEVPTDVSKREQCRALIDQTVEKWGRIDAFFSVAGISMWSKFEEVTDISFFEKLVAVNYLGPLYCTHYALPHLKESRGQIVVVTSSSGKVSAPLHSGYAASKHALHGFFDALRTELAGSGIRITLSVPLFVRTAIRLHGFQGDGTHPDEDPYHDRGSMTADEAARRTIRAARKGKREVVMTLELKAAVKLRPFIPGVVDFFARKKVGFK
jgi:NAD(P)-dependent dehydrogenase (short-subunit alcohol dehydrogenase family)